MFGAVLRPYLATDRAGLYRVAADSAFFGQPVERFLDDRCLFCDLTYSYYLDFEPRHSWVVASDESVVGFLAGCIDTSVKERIFRQRVLPHLIVRLLNGRYVIGRRTIRQALAEIRGALSGDFPTVDLNAYPAHLHINVDARSRGHGAGRGLIEAYLKQLRDLGIRGVHLRTTNLNEAAIRLYTRLGFSLLAVHPTRVWAHVSPQAVENRVYGLTLLHG